MLEMKNFVFYGAPIKIETENWRIDFVSDGSDTSTIEIVKYHHLGNRAWSFKIMRKEDKLFIQPMLCSADDPIGEYIIFTKQTFDGCGLDWRTVNIIFHDLITYLNR